MNWLQSKRGEGGDSEQRGAVIETELGQMATVGIVGRILAEGHLPGDRREMTSFATILK